MADAMTHRTWFNDGTGRRVVPTSAEAYYRLKERFEMGILEAVDTAFGLYGTEMAFVYLMRELVDTARCYKLEGVPREAGRRPISGSIRREVFERDEYRCVKCGGWLDLTVDHIFPWSKGGPDHIENFQTLCGSCNASKGAR